MLCTQFDAIECARRIPSNCKGREGCIEVRPIDFAVAHLSLDPIAAGNRCEESAKAYREAPALATNRIEQGFPKRRLVEPIG